MSRDYGAWFGGGDECFRGGECWVVNGLRAAGGGEQVGLFVCLFVRTMRCLLPGRLMSMSTLKTSLRVFADGGGG